MKNYTVILSKQVTIEDIEADSASEAKNKAKKSIKGDDGFFVQEIYDHTNDCEVMICEFCDKDILDSDLRFYDEDGNRYCSTCYNDNQP